MCQAFGQAAFPVDTHIHRLAQRWGLTDGRNVEQTEAGERTYLTWRGGGWALVHTPYAGSKRGARSTARQLLPRLPAASHADLKLLFPEHSWKDLHLQVIFFGREQCAGLRVLRSGN